MDRPHGLIETLADRLGPVAYVAATITVVREWGDRPAVWRAVAAGALASPIGMLAGSLVILLPALVIGKLAPVKTPGLGHELVHIAPLIGVGWACYLAAESFGVV